MLLPLTRPKYVMHKIQNRNIGGAILGLICFFVSNEYLDWGVSKVSEFFFDGPFKEAHGKRKKKSELGRHPQTNQFESHYIINSHQLPYSGLYKVTPSVGWVPMLLGAILVPFEGTKLEGNRNWTLG